MRKGLSWLLVAIALVLAARPVDALVEPASAEDGGPLPDWDIRADLGVQAAPTQRQLDALAVLEKEVAVAPGGPLVVRWGPRPGTIHYLFRRSGFLSAARPGAAPDDVALAFIAAHRELLGLSADGVAALEHLGRVDDPGTRAAHVCFRQRVDGLPILHGLIRVNLDRHGRILSVGGTTLREEILSAVQRLDADAALVAAARSVRVSLEAAPPRMPAEPSDEKGTVRFAQGPFESASWAHLRWFPRDGVQGAAGGLVKAWVVIVDPKNDAGWYQVVVDARTGEILARFDLVDFIAAQGLVFRADPGQGPQVTIPFIDDVAFTDAASPAGWSASGQTEGNNCDSKDDRANDNETTAGQRATGTPGPPLSFAFPFTDNTAVDLNASCTNAFYLNNWLHDELVRNGFDEQSGNFQDVNFTGRGLGGDRVYVDVQDGSGTNNANFGTPPDGSHPRMQMYIWTVTNPFRDSAFDASVVTHELHHGVSNRLVGLLENDAGCLGGPQGGAMGEAWSDFFACSLWNETVVGGYVVDNQGRGIRRAPYDAYPYNYGDLCNQGGFEVHRDGEIWAAQLWRLRELFIGKYGYQRGKCMIERLVLDGMKLSPCAPTYVDMRDAIILAAQLEGVDGDACLLWQGFAERGLGIGAVSRADCTTPADASFAMPPECATCGAFAAPTAVVVDAAQPNRVVVSFAPSPGATEHLLLRAPGSCPGDCLDAQFAEIARGSGTATSLEDVDSPASPLSAGDRFAYRVVALSGACNASSPCTETTIAGRCTLRPEPITPGAVGVVTLARPPRSTCSIDVGWEPQRPACAPFGRVRYNVYRSQDPAFVPGPENLIASVMDPATTFSDLAAPPVVLTYVVRAEDLTTGGEGPHGGNEESNDVRLSLAPQGVITGTRTFLDDAESGELPGYRRTGSFTPNDWGIVSDANTRGGSAWHVTDVEGGNADKNLHLPPMSLSLAAPHLRFNHIYQFEPRFDGGVIEISTDGGRTWRDLVDDIVLGGYSGQTLTVDDMIHPPNTDRLWTDENPSGFPSYDAVDVDLSPYAGTLDAQLRFRALVDPLAAEPGGWYVDDITVDEIETFGACVSSCIAPPRAALPDILACTSATSPVDVVLDASSSTMGAAGPALDLPFVLFHDGPGSFSGRRWAPGPVATLTFPAGTPSGDYSVGLAVRDADGCTDEATATISLRDETFVPSPVGPTLRVIKSGAGISLSWTDVGAPLYNVVMLPLSAGRPALSSMATATPFSRNSSSPAILATGLSAQGGGTAFIQVFSASDCGRSVP